MSDHPYEIHDRNVIQDGESQRSPKPKRRARRGEKRRDRRRRRWKDPRRNTRHDGDLSSSLSDDNNQHQRFNGINGIDPSQGHYRWTKLPDALLKITLERENRSWIEEAGGEFTDQTLFQRLTEAAPTASRGMTQEVQELSSFCGSQTLQDLELGSVNIPSTEAYLDDRTTEGCRSDRQRPPGPLSMRQLYLELKEPRFPSYRQHRAKDQDTDVVKNNLVHPVPCQNADRRLIFQTDLNPWGAMALVYTASQREAPKIYGMVNRHLTFESFIGVRNVGSKQFPLYEFAFDLPYFAWRTTPFDTKPDDAKSRGRDRPLRNVQDLSFLSMSRSSSARASLTDYLCEAHTSVLISAIDSRRNISYAFVDSYFDDEEERESAKDYFDYPPDIDDYCDSDSNDGEDQYLEHDLIQSDPLTRGQFDTNMPLQDPWRYFWAAFKARMEAVEGEWRIVVKNAEDRIKRHIDSAPLDNGPFSLISTEEHCAWIRQTKRLLGRMIKTLEGLIKDWKRFQAQETFSQDAVAREFSDVQNSFQRLEKCVWKLKCLQKECNDFSEVVTLYMAAVANRGSEIQTGFARFGFTVAIIMLVVQLPVTLSSGIYSMQADAIPQFLRPTKHSFVALTGSLAGAVSLVSLLIHFRHIGITLWRTCFQLEASTNREDIHILKEE